VGLVYPRLPNGIVTGTIVGNGKSNFHPIVFHPIVRPQLADRVHALWAAQLAVRPILCPKWYIYLQHV
jgi:hypothetical protein